MVQQKRLTFGITVGGTKRQNVRRVCQTSEILKEDTFKNRIEKNYYTVLIYQSALNAWWIRLITNASYLNALSVLIPCLILYVCHLFPKH